VSPGIRLRLALPAPVRDAEAKASFAKKKGVLTIFMPLEGGGEGEVLV